MASGAPTNAAAAHSAHSGHSAGSTAAGVYSHLGSILALAKNVATLTNVPILPTILKALNSTAGIANVRRS